MIEPAQRVLVWQDSSSWFPHVRDCLRAERRALGGARLERELAEKALHRDVVVQQVFSHVRVYHACRPTDIGSYYREGIRCWDSRIEDLARERFSGLPRVTLDALERAIAKLKAGRETETGEVHLTLDDRLLPEDAGHYLIYGSEFVMAVAAYLVSEGAPLYQYHLKSFGTPTVFTCEVPLDLLSEVQRFYLAQTFVQAYRECRGRQPRRSPVIDHTVTLRVDVPPSALVSHYHPERMIDYHNGGTWYEWQPRNP